MVRVFICNGTIMEKLSRILHDLDQGNINVELAKQQVMDLLPSNELIRERGASFESKAYYNLGEGEYIGDFEIGAKWAVDSFLGNDR